MNNLALWDALDEEGGEEGGSQEWTLVNLSLWSVQE